MLKLFGVEPDVDLGIMEPGQDVLDESAPDLVMVQGDTTTSYLTALAAFYKKIPVLHVEAGLRSHDPYNPFPEEMNRKQITHLSRHHFAPTSLNKKNLLLEGMVENAITVTGNTVIDALQFIKHSESYMRSKPEILSGIGSADKLIVLTAHRRENHGEPLQNIFRSVNELLSTNTDLKVVFPIHPNPAVQEALTEVWINSDRFLQTTPFDYLSFLHILDRADLILTDSGGIQEEAASLGKPVLVLRGETERQELIESELGELVGTDTSKIIDRSNWYLSEENSSVTTSIFGDGTAAQQIRDVILNQL